MQVRTAQPQGRVREWDGRRARRRRARGAGGRHEPSRMRRRRDAGDRCRRGRQGSDGEARRLGTASVQHVQPVAAEGRASVLARSVTAGPSSAVRDRGGSSITQPMHWPRGASVRTLAGARGARASNIQDSRPGTTLSWPGARDLCAPLGRSHGVLTLRVGDRVSAPSAGARGRRAARTRRSRRGTSRRSRRPARRAPPRRARGPPARSRARVAGAA